MRAPQFNDDLPDWPKMGSFQKAGRKIALEEKAFHNGQRIDWDWGGEFISTSLAPRVFDLDRDVPWINEED